MKGSLLSLTHVFTIPKIILKILLFDHFGRPVLILSSIDFKSIIS